MAIKQFHHIAVTVTDLQAARRFFMEGLGFTQMLNPDGSPRAMSVGGGDAGRQVAQALELDGEWVGDVAFVERQDHVLELVQYNVPAAEQRGLRPMSVCGVSHLCFLVSDVDNVATRLRELGGNVLEHTRIDVPLADGSSQVRMMCTSPDGGVRIELVQALSTVAN